MRRLAVTAAVSPPHVDLDKNDVAALIGADERTVLRYAARGILPHYRIGRLIRFSREDITAFLAAARVPAKGAS